MTTKATSIYIDQRLIDMVDNVIQMRRLGGIETSRSKIVTEALVAYLRDYRETLIAEVDQVRQQIDEYQASLRNGDFDLNVDYSEGAVDLSKDDSIQACVSTDTGG